MSRKEAVALARLTDIQIHEQVQQSQSQLRVVEEMFDRLGERTQVTLIQRDHVREPDDDK